MKNKILAAMMLLAATAMLCCCSDDKDNPQPLSKEEYPSMVTEFLETYGFRSLPTINENGKETWDAMILPIEGVETYKVFYNKTIDGMNIVATIHEGKAYNFKNNPRHFNKLLEKYVDTHYDGSKENISIDKLPYRPHPYGITRIDMRLEDKFTSRPTPITKNPSITWMPDYNKNYPCGSKCNSLFRIRYRTFYDYIRNGYTWEGLDHKSQWKEMELTDFNSRGGDKLIDMSRFYLIVKERPDSDYSHPWPLAMTVTFDNGKTNKRNSDLRMQMEIDPAR